MGNGTRQRLPCAGVNSPNHPPGTWSPDSRGGGGGAAAQTTTATGCGDRGAPGPDGSPGTALSLRPAGDLRVPLPSIIVAETSLVKFHLICPPIYHKLLLLLLLRNRLTTPSYPHLNLLCSSFNHLWMWVEAGGGFEGVEAKTTHYITYLLIQGC